MEFQSTATNSARNSKRPEIQHGRGQQLVRPDGQRVPGPTVQADELQRRRHPPCQDGRTCQAAARCPCAPDERNNLAAAPSRQPGQQRAPEPPSSARASAPNDGRSSEAKVPPRRQFQRLQRPAAAANERCRPHDADDRHEHPAAEAAALPAEAGDHAAASAPSRVRALQRGQTFRPFDEHRPVGPVLNRAGGEGGR